MKRKIPSLMWIFLAITLMAYIGASFGFCYTTKPKISKGEFPFSITYEYQGETKTLAGVLECEYSGSKTIQGKHYRYWDVETTYENQGNMENPCIVEQNDELQTVLAIYENMDAGYFMGDPLHKDYYNENGYEAVEPYIEYYDYKNDIYLEEENKDEILTSIGFKIVDYTYAEPIDNSFSFSGIKYGSDNVVIFIAISLVFFLLCLTFVRKDKKYKYSKLDKFGIVLNFLEGIVVVPFISVACMLFGIVESDVELINQITYNIPSVAILCLALSVAFRRKGFSKAGFWIQFARILMFICVFILGFRSRSISG